MKVLHLSETPLSSAPYRLMQVQREGGMDARLITHKPKYTDTSKIVHPYDIILQDGRTNEEKRGKGLPFSREEVFHLFENCDVIHCHNFVSNHFVFRLFPELRKYLKKKRVIFQAHSPRRNIPEINKHLKNKDIDKKLVIAQYQARLFPECEVVPNVVPINDPDHKPVDTNKGIPRICYSPSNSKLKGWNNKGKDVVLEAVKKMQSPHEFIIIEETPFLECLRIKQQCDICIDEVMTGSYHMSSLEALSQGLAVINGIDAECEEALDKWTNAGKEHPMVKASPENLTNALDELCSNEVKLLNQRKYSRKFMEKYWSTNKIIKKFTEVYTK